MYVVLGATGNTGSVVAKRLLERGKKVRVVGRDAGRLSTLKQLGAETAAVDVNDTAALTKILEGASGAYLLLPPGIQDPEFLAAGDRISTAITAAVSASRIPHVVLLSSIGAQLTNKTGPIQGLHAFEEKLKKVPNLNALFLRPAFFMENFLMLIPLVQSMGFLAGGIKGDVTMPMIATRDIGEAAAEALLKLDFAGCSSRELLGQRDLSHDEVASAIGTGIGKPTLSYQKFPALMVEQGLKEMGIPGKTASLLSEMDDALSSGLVKAQEERSDKNTTPTAIETWVQEVFVPAYNAKAAGA